MPLEDLFGRLLESARSLKTDFAILKKSLTDTEQHLIMLIGWDERQGKG